MTEAESITTSSGPLAPLVRLTGAPEEAIRLLLTILAGYPLALIYHRYVESLSNKQIHHTLFAGCGMLLCAFNYGYDTKHSLFAIATTYSLLKLFHAQPQILKICNFIFHLTYLVVGYYYTASDSYDINWTMPHCVLVLRMIGLGFDVADGTKPEEQLSNDQKQTALKNLPTPLELLAFAYFPCSFIVGPQFPFRRYQRFINGEFRPYGGCFSAGFNRLCLGLIYLSIRQVGSTWLPDEYLLSDEYAQKPFLVRFVLMGLWGKFALYKYVSCWLLTEGTLMYMGISYAGKDAKGMEDWSGCCNVKVYLFETGNNMSHYVQSFNVNTNQWVAQYIYKRLKFLNNRTISYGSALAFLAVWHGYHSGYYMSFFMEYVVVTMEKQIENFYQKELLPKYGTFMKSSMLYIALEFIVLKTYNVVYIGYCLTPFIFLSYERWNRVFKNVHYFGYGIIFFWFTFSFIYYKLRPRPSRASAAAAGSAAAPTATNTLTDNAATKTKANKTD